jgi:hypothetical protein
MKNLSCARHSMKMIGGALISVAILSHVSVACAEETQTDPQALARELLDPAARKSSVQAETSQSDAHLAPQLQAQCMILGAACEIPGGDRASAAFTDVSSSPDARRRDRRIDAADLARQMILGLRA